MHKMYEDGIGGGHEEEAAASLFGSFASASGGHRNLLGRLLGGGGGSSSDGHGFAAFEIGDKYFTQEYIDIEHHLHEDLKHSLHECDYILALSMLHLVSPIKYAAIAFFTARTRRAWTVSQQFLVVEMMLVGLVLVWIYDRLHYTFWD